MDGLGTILATVWTLVGVPLVVRGFRWLGSRINQNKVMARWQIDDQIRNALRIAVANIGNKTADIIRNSPLVGDEWTDDVKAGLCREAKAQAFLLLDDTARKVCHEMGDRAIDILIRKYVDEREEGKKP